MHDAERQVKASARQSLVGVRGGQSQGKAARLGPNSDFTLLASTMILEFAQEQPDASCFRHWTPAPSDATWAREIPHALLALARHLRRPCTTARFRSILLHGCLTLRLCLTRQYMACAGSWRSFLGSDSAPLVLSQSVQGQSFSSWALAPCVAHTTASRCLRFSFHFSSTQAVCSAGILALHLTSWLQIHAIH